MGPYFAIFVAAWVYLRHYLNLRIIWSLFTEFRTVGPFELDWATEQYKCTLSQVITTVLLCSLQGLNLFWFYCIMRIALRFVFKGQAKDDRSDGEDDTEEEEEESSSSGGPTIVVDDEKMRAAAASSTAVSNGSAVPRANGKAKR